MTETKLLLADVDGTLVTHDKILTDRAKKAVEGLHDAGIRFAITSGRPPQGLAMLIEPLKLDGVIAGFNGGAIVNPDLSVVQTHTIPREVAEKALALILDHKLDAWVYTAEDWFLRDKDAPHSEREQWTVQFAPTVVQGFDQVIGKAVKIVGVSDDLKLVEKTESDMQAALGDTASAARSQPYYLDVTHPKANKGEVVRFLAERYGIAPDSIATIGDMPNDITMFRAGGVSIAMGQSADQVKQAATHVTAGYADEGFAKGVEKYLLGKG